MMQASGASESFQGKLNLVQRNQAGRIPVKVMALGLMLVSAQGFASTGSSWSKTPAWSASEEPARPATHKSVHSHESSASEPTPFSPGSNNLALDLGQVFLMGDLNSQYDNSLGTQLHYTYGVSDIFGFDSSLGYSEHSNGNFSMTTALTGVRMNLSWYDRIIPYAVVGLGFYRPHYKNGSGLLPGGTSTFVADSASVSSILFGIHLGPGVDLQLTRNLFFGAAITYHSMFGSTQVLPSGNQVSLGGSYTSFFLHLGATF